MYIYIYIEPVVVVLGFSEHLGGKPSESYGLSSFYTPLWDTLINPG